MLFKVKRVYIGSGLESEVLINDTLVQSIEPSNDSQKPQTRIVTTEPGTTDPRIIYTNSTVLNIFKHIRSLY